jgi:hypothetical protein
MKYIISVLFLSLLTTLSYSQLQLTESDFTALVGKTFTQTSFSDTNDDAAISALVAKSGTGQTWDLSALQNFYAASTATYEVQAGTAGVPDGGVAAFQSATHVIKVLGITGFDGQAYNFVILSSSSYQDIGTNTTGPNGATLTYSPPKTEYVFPVQFGSKWSSTTTESVSGQNINLSFTDEVDGEGTLIIPGGSSAPVLRLKETTITTASFGGFTINDTATTYRFIDKTNTVSGSLSAPQVKTIGGIFTQNIKGNASYSGRSSGAIGSVKENLSDIVDIHLSQNPAQAETELLYTMKQDGNCSIGLMDALGKEVYPLYNGRAAAGQNIIPINASKLSPGAYFIRVDAGGVSTTRKLIITK